MPELDRRQIGGDALGGKSGRRSPVALTVGLHLVRTRQEERHQKRRDEPQPVAAPDPVPPLAGHAASIAG
jgi:hypothetical protein